ncbi:MAG: MoaD family protein [Litorilinea sp.]|uniref:MoaD/ThiS family protein n=2 Tax=Litorilinea aerophila TaxID=1204385 RepID=A0A540VDW0_9CHLR|nr:MAG: MoaD family protein [Litorilinea sp.]
MGGGLNDSMEHEVWIPSLHRDLTGGVEQVTVSGETVGEVIDALEARFPGIRERLCDGDRIHPYIAVVINGEMSRRGLRHRLKEPSEIHFVPAIGGG